MDNPVVIENIIGACGHPDLADRLHELGHQGALETLAIGPDDLPRRRFHAHTDRGTACFVSLPRSVQLFDGAVVHLDETRAVVVRVGEQRWLTLRPAPAAALELGYLAGNLHWRVRFAGDCLLVALEGPIDGYLARLQDFRDAGKVSLVE